MTASTVNDSSAVRGTKILWVFARWSGGFTRYPSGELCSRSAGINPSSTSLSLNRSRTQRPSVRGRVVNVFRVSDSESPNSRTKYTPLISRRSIEITVPAVFSTSTLPSCTICAGDTYPETESRSIFRTITFLWVDGIAVCHPETDILSPPKDLGEPRRLRRVFGDAQNGRLARVRIDSRTFPPISPGIRLGSSQNVNCVLFS